MDTEMKRTWAEIHLENLAHNVEQIRAKLPAGCRYLGVVKANAYGHGDVEVSRCLEQMGVTNLAVACYDEAKKLREAGIRAEILILGPSPAELAPDIARLGNVCQAVGSYRLADEMNMALMGTGLTLGIHIKLETGMGRTGFAVTRPGATDEAAKAMNLPHLDPEGVFTHFCVSDEPEKDFTEIQFQRFLHGIGEIEEKSGRNFRIRHCTNSGAMVNFPETCLDMVRPGLLQYGLYPGEEHGGLDLKPVMKLMSRVVEITDHNESDTISYGQTYICPGPKRFAVIPIGYGDGLHRVLSNQLQVRIGSHWAQQRGRICMDMCMVDITDFPDIQVGDPVEIFGDRQSVDVLADQAGTISYELLCGVSNRVPRIYFH